jgi:hypothetical protein
MIKCITITTLLLTFITLIIVALIIYFERVKPNPIGFTIDEYCRIDLGKVNWTECYQVIREGL